MSRKKNSRLPSGNYRKRVYDHSELILDEHGHPVIDPKTGKLKKKRIYASVTASTSSEVELMAAEIKNNRAAVQKPSKMTLYEAITKYIEMNDALLSPSTIAGYVKMQRTGFPHIMHMPLSAFNVTMLREAVNQECKRPKLKNGSGCISSKTVINEYRLLGAVLHVYAPHLDYTSVRLPQVEHNQHHLSKPDVIFQMIQGTSIELPCLLAIWLSFTVSEILGLTKSKSISPDGNYITIRDVIVLDRNNAQVVKNKGKYSSRDRTLRIPDYIKHLINQVDGDRLVTISGPALSKRFARLVKNAGIPHMTFHDLRHVNASVMTILHVPDKYAQERGGWHSDAIMKSVYMQTFDEDRAAVDASIDEYFSSIVGQRADDGKYNAWLTLFDRKDNVANRKAFEAFQKMHHGMHHED